jgi:hypothetical protein
LIFEFISGNQIGISFSNRFFDEQIKNTIKSLPYSDYNHNSKVWQVPFGRKKEVCELLKEYCHQNIISIHDIPGFVEEITAIAIPFQRTSKGRKYDYT